MIDITKPLRIGKCEFTGIPIVIKMVADEVKEFLEIMEHVPDSYVLKDDKGVYYLHVPEGRFEISVKHLPKILECLSEDALTDKLFLCKISLKTIRRYQ